MSPAEARGATEPLAHRRVGKRPERAATVPQRRSLPKKTGEGLLQASARCRGGLERHVRRVGDADGDDLTTYSTVRVRDRMDVDIPLVATQNLQRGVEGR